jgi:Apea-like HEPN
MEQWCVVGPIYDLRIDGSLRDPVEFSGGVKLCKIPEWVKNEQFARSLNSRQRERLLKNVEFAFIAEYEAESFNDPDPEWKGKGAVTKAGRKEALFAFANLALWLARPSAARFDFIIHAKRDTFPLWLFDGTSLFIAPLLVGRSEEDNILSSTDLELAQKMHLSLANLQPDTTLWTTVNMGWIAITIDAQPLRYLSLWVALESLFGPEDGREINYRLSQRMAFFLEDNRQSARKVFSTAKTGYDYRSKVAHGKLSSKKFKPDPEEMLSETETLFRKSLIRILSDPLLIATFNGKSRETYLDDLLFSSK